MKIARISLFLVHPFWKEKGFWEPLNRDFDLKKHILFEKFKKSNVPQNKKEELIALAKQMKLEQLLLIIYK